MQGYFGCAVGKAKQAAKTEIEKVKLGDMTCQELVKEAARMWVLIFIPSLHENFHFTPGIWIGQIFQPIQSSAHLFLEREDF